MGCKKNVLTHVLYISNFQCFSSHGINKLATNILQNTKNIYFANLTKIGIILIHSHQTAIVIFLFANLKEKRSVPLTKQSAIASFKDARGTLVEKLLPQITIFHRVQQLCFLIHIYLYIWINIYMHAYIHIHIYMRIHIYIYI